jgi:hypothetical protein
MAQLVRQHGHQLVLRQLAGLDRLDGPTGDRDAAPVGGVGIRLPSGLNAQVDVTGNGSDRSEGRRPCRLEHRRLRRVGSLESAHGAKGHPLANRGSSSRDGRSPPRDNARVSGLFISYRRQDAAAYAGRLQDELATRYGRGQVFLDVADLLPGEDFASRLDAAISSADVILVVIGPQWLDAVDPYGRRRIDDPDDFIRSEVASALRLGKRVVPILVDGAQVPRQEALPDELRGLARRQAVVLTHENWRPTLQTLFQVLDPLFGPGGTASPPAAPGSLRAAPEAEAPVSSTLSFGSRLVRAYKVLRGHESGDAGPPAVARPALTSAPSLSLAATPVRGHDVFVSHASADRAFVETLVSALERVGWPCWVSYRDIPAGVPSWAEPIVTAIASSRLVLVLLTKQSIPSMELMREVTLAADEKIPLLPVSLDGTALSPGLRYFFVAGQRLDLATVDSADQVRRIVPAVAASLPAR